MKPEDRVLVDLIKRTEEGKLSLASDVNQSDTKILNRLAKKGLARKWVRRSRRGQLYTLWEAVDSID